MGFDGVKKVETDEEDEGVSYSEDERSAGVQGKAQDGFSLMGEVRYSWLKKSKVGSNVKAPAFRLGVSSNTREKPASLSLATDIGWDA